MGWDFRYSIRLGQPLSPEEKRRLDVICERHGKNLQAVFRGPPRFEEWKALGVPVPPWRPPAAEVDDGADYRDTVRVANPRHLLRLVEWLLEVEAAVPKAEVLVSDDYTFSAARPSEVALEELRAAARRRRKKARRDETLEPAEAAVLERVGQEDLDRVAGTLEEARRAFEQYKALRDRK